MCETGIETDQILFSEPESFHKSKKNCPTLIRTKNPPNELYDFPMMES
jgi:hypothetical protein